MYKKFASIFLMVSLSLFIFTISYAIDVNVYYDATKLNNMTIGGCSICNYTSAEVNNILQNYKSDSSNESYKNAYDLLLNTLDAEGYQYLVYEYGGRYVLMTDTLEYDVDIVTVPYSSTSSSYHFGLLYDDYHDTTIKLGHLYGWTENCCCEFKISSDVSLAYNFISDKLPLISTNANIYQMTYKSSSKFYWDGSSYFYKATADKPSMQNPLTNEEILSLVNELLASEAAAHRPKDYNKLFIQYDTGIDAYFAFFYPDDATVKGGIRPAEESEFEYDTYVLYGNQTVGFWESFFDASKTPVNFNYYVCSKGTQLNPDSWGFFKNENNQQVSVTYYSCLTRPIVYTTHDLGFMLWNLDESGNPVEDEVNSIPETEVTDANGNKVDFVFPEVVDDDPNVLMFVGTFLRVILAIFNVLVRFIAFITTLMAIPADSSLLLPEFVQGIDWIKALDINGISIFAFFQISIIIAFGIGVVKFIKEAFTE